MEKTEHKAYKILFGEQLKKAMKYRNVSVKELAEAIGRSESSIRRYLNGEANFAMELLVSICNKLNVLPSYLFGDPIMEQETMDVANRILRSINVDHDWDEKEPELLRAAAALTDEQRVQIGEHFELLLKRSEEKKRLQE